VDVAAGCVTVLSRHVKFPARNTGLVLYHRYQSNEQHYFSIIRSSYCIVSGIVFNHRTLF